MSFGFSIGDIIAISKLVKGISEAIKDAPREYEEFRREMKSCSIVIDAVENEARNPHSALYRSENSNQRSRELATLCFHLQTSLRELQAIIESSGNIGNYWTRLRLGSRNLVDLRAKIITHVSLINQFMTTLTLGSVGRIEFGMNEVLELVRGLAHQGNIRMGADSVVSVRDDSGDVGENWEPLELRLVADGAPLTFVRANRYRIREVVEAAMEEASQAPNARTTSISADTISEDGDTVAPNDSISQLGRQQNDAANHTSIQSIRNVGRSRDDHKTNSASGEDLINLNDGLPRVTKQEITLALTALSNYGYPLKNPVIPPRPSTFIKRITQIRVHLDTLGRALRTAATVGNLLAIRLLVYQGLKHSVKNWIWAMLKCATEADLDDVTTEEVVRSLVRLTGKHKHFPSALVLAIRKNKLQTVRYLLDTGYSIDALATMVDPPHLPLSQAIVNRSVEMTSELITRGANVNLSIYNGDTMRYATVWEFFEYCCRVHPNDPSLRQIGILLRSAGAGA